MKFPTFLLYYARYLDFLLLSKKLRAHKLEVVLEIEQWLEVNFITVTLSHPCHQVLLSLGLSWLALRSGFSFLLGFAAVV